MFPNLLGQKAFHHLNNDEMAAIIGTSRKTYEAKIQNGKFTAVECAKYCLYFGKTFEYLFATDDTRTA